MGKAPYRRDERVVAASPDASAPEYRMRAIVCREFHADSPAVRLVVDGPMGSETAYWDSKHVELVIALLGEALPELRSVEAAIESEWDDWLGRAVGSRPESV